MRSTKLLRLPQRGALGNGVRVIAGAVLASEGTLAVITRNRRIELRPQADGSTAVIQVTKIDHPVGTRVEIGFGAALPPDADIFDWARAANSVASIGKVYEGGSSPFWFDASPFHEVLLACGSQPVRSLIAQLDGCTGGKAGEIVGAAGLDRMVCEDINREQATRLLEAARKEARKVSPERLGHVGRDAFPGHWYAIQCGTVSMGSSKPHADMPFVVEAWARKTTPKGKIEKAFDRIEIAVLINRTPAVTQMTVWRDENKNLCLRGNGLSNYTEEVPKKGAYDVKVNVTTPYCPITSDGKAPDLKPFVNEIMVAIATAMRKAQRAAPKEKKVYQIDVVLDNLDDVIADVSGGGEFRFNARQLFYALRPIVMEEAGEELKLSNFTNIITNYEAEFGEIKGMYREPRGSITHPHGGETIALGTLMVEEYERPIWKFNKVIYIEKEGANEALKAVHWLDRHDCTVISSKGYSTRAARDLIDMLAEHDEPVTVYCAHDADAYGTMIFQSLQEATKARGARKIKIVNIGLEPWEAIEMDLEVETVEEGEHRKPVAKYVLEREDSAPDGDTWENWLQTHRVELNAMTTPEFIAWLDDKMAEHGFGKLIPPEVVVLAELESRLEAKVRAAITERIMREAGFEKQVAAALAEIERPSGDDLADGIKASFRV